MPKRSSPMLLQARQLSKSYGGKPALQQLDLELRAGEMVALVGRNGAGKSTLLQLLTGLFAPDQGDIQVCGHDLRRHPGAALACLGVVFQQPAIDLELSVLTNLLYSADLHGLPRRTARERIAVELQRLGLDGLESRTVRTLSGGTRRKVELVRALLHRPQVLLMDEATVGLDPASRSQMLRTVVELCQGGLCALWATHLLDEARQADRFILLDQGRVRLQGSAAKLPGVKAADDFIAALVEREPVPTGA